jgi:hypothetical protein
MQVLAELLQHFLLSLEQVELQLVLNVVPVHVGKLKDMAAADYFIDCLLEEGKLGEGVALDVVKKVDLGLNHWLQRLGLPLGLVVIVVPLEVEHVLLQLILSILYLLLLLHYFLVASFFSLFVFVTLVISSGGGAVLGPVAEAEPAKLVLAEAAGHVVAALVLLDGLGAAGAVLCVGHNPGNVLGLSRVFEAPLFCGFAVSRLVRFLATLEAEGTPALAVDLHDA